PAAGYQNEYGGYGAYGQEQYQGAQQQYDQGAYGQQPYQAEGPYQGEPYPAGAYQDGTGGQFEQGGYDPYTYGEQGQTQQPRDGEYDPAWDQAYGQGRYDTPYDPSQPDHPHGPGSERPHGSQQ
ncbi:hypothetical protein M4J08_001965, partial [Streptomyces parvulus]|nr:hypothetical protein [Streptomyces parvulus]